MRQVGAAEWERLRAGDPYLRWGVDPGGPPLVWVPDEDAPDPPAADPSAAGSEAAGSMPAGPAPAGAATRVTGLAGSGLVAISRLRRAGGPRSLVIIEHEAARPAQRSCGADVDGLADQVAVLAAQVLAIMQAGGLTVPRRVAGQVRDRLDDVLPAGGLEGPVEGIGWDWTWSDRRLPGPERDRAERSMRAAGVRLDLLDVANPLVAREIDELLTSSSPRHSAGPGDPRVRQWFGFRRADVAAIAGGPSRDGAAAGTGGTRTDGGDLVACAAWYESVPGIPLLASVAVSGTHRRLGLGAAMMVTVTEAAFASGCPAVTVDLYADNDPARQLYRTLGFVTAQEFASWPLNAHDLDDA